MSRLKSPNGAHVTGLKSITFFHGTDSASAHSFSGKGQNPLIDRPADNATVFACFLPADAARTSRECSVAT